MGGETWRNGLNSPRKLLILSLFVIALSPLTFAASAAKIYITPNGTAQGACTTGPQTPAWFNNSANWGSGSGQIGPGTTVTLCGTFTGTANQQLLTIKGSGSSGNPITILFDTGTVLNSPYWSNAGAIIASNVSWITIDGGSNGTIQNTANGTGLANQQPSAAIIALPCSNCEFRNLIISNLYVHTGGGCEIDQTQVNAIKFSGQNVLVHDNTIHDVGWSIWDDYGNNDTNHQVYNNDVSHSDHTLIFAGNGLTGVNLGAQFYNNHIHDFSNWDTTGDCYHHDGLHGFGSSGSPAMTLYFYNNQCDGALGNNFNACLFMEGTGSGTPWTGNSAGSTYYAFNNVFAVNGSHSAIQAALGNGDLFVNNTVLCTDSLSGDISYDAGSSTGNSFKNNAEQGCGYFMLWNGFGVNNLSTDVDHNAYASAQGYNAFNYTDKGIDTSSFPTWQSQCGCDSHGLYNASSLNISSTTYLPNSGSPVIGAGANLTNLCTGNLAPLCSDKAGVLRPATGGWDDGAYQYSSGAGIPAPPTGLTAVIQ
jgi:hypothetical protein